MREVWERVKWFQHIENKINVEKMLRQSLNDNMSQPLGVKQPQHQLSTNVERMTV